jgi:predicted amidohydrolase
MSSFRIALVQPITVAPPDDEANVAAAVEWIARATSQGADFVCFPESYPGPWRMPAPYDPSNAIAEAAVKHGVHAVFGTVEPIDEAKAPAYNLTCMAFPDGRPVARYRRSHPNGPWIYSGGKYWEFQYVAGNDYPIFDTKHGKVGLAMCSEVYMPEVARALALRGAELIFMPAGLDKRRLWESWRTLLYARAIENLAIVVSTQNLLSHANRGDCRLARSSALRKHDRRDGHRRTEPRPHPRAARPPRHAELVGELRRQARRPLRAMATPRALRQLLPEAPETGGRVRL